MSIYERMDNELAAKDDRISELERENAALKKAVLFFDKCQWKPDCDEWFAADEKAAANVIIRRALEIARKEAQS